MDLIGLVLRTPMVLISDESAKDTASTIMDGSNNNIMGAGRKLLKGKVIGGRE